MNEPEFALYSITKLFPTLYLRLIIQYLQNIVHAGRTVHMQPNFEDNWQPFRAKFQIHDERERKLYTKIVQKCFTH